MTSPDRPNIIFIVVDDCGYADLGCTGQTGYRTPALDRLAGERVRFTQAYANAPLCTNTRVALITGRYQYRLKLGLVEPLRPANRDEPEMGIPPGFPTLPSLLRAAGYRTALIGKWHLGFLPKYGPLKSGYDDFFGIMGGFTGYYTHRGEGGEPDLYEGELPVERAGYVTDLLSERALAYVEAAAQSPTPYFLSLHYNAPHWPWSAPSIEAAARQREVDRAEIMEGGSPRIYGEMMQILDAGICWVIDAARHSGKDTLVIFTSDNGGERYSNIWPFVGRKWDLLEGGLRVPQIVWWPGHIKAGQVTEQVCITMDLTATPQVDVVVRSANWEQTQWGAATFIRCAPCDNCPVDVKNQHPTGGYSPELAYFFHSARVCAAGAGAITGGAIGVVVGVILGVLVGIAATGGCGFAALACLALAVIVSVIIAAATTLIGASIGGTIGRYSVANDEDPTAPGPGDATMTISAGDYLTASGNLITTAFVNNANAYWFVGYGVDDMGSVTDMRTPANPGIMKHGRSKQALPPYCYTDPDAQTF